MSNQEDLPEIVVTPDVSAFIDALDQAYPRRCITFGEDLISAHRYAAVREFIDQLLSIKEEHQEGYDEDSGDASG